ncbi:hypothetical protein C1H46_014931 [Malus baccata]|uniref:BAHD acyltransferase DCR n=1 Tax=Malus baccata TaxID=106549 RepID=A0A540MKZ6_MALBA|nr:hypothetical protein C1H46_014931 [Malus baccata]
MADISKVKVTGKTHVKPNKKIGSQQCQLITFDLPYLAFYYNQKLLFYKGGEFEEMVKKLKEGLEVVLGEFYQLAGKLGKDDEGVFRVEYGDEMEGVEVAEAAAEEISIADLAVEEGTSALKDFIPYNGVLNLEGDHRPLLAVQLTKLKDGLAIGCAFNHAILDGTSTWHFMSSWAEICNGSKSISTQPFLDRTQARNTRVKLDISPPPSNGDVLANGKKDPNLRERVFKFPEAAIDKIKSTVNENLPSDGSKPFSTFQSLSVHIWRHVTQARQLKPDDYTVLTVFADCRKWVDPPMPDTYFGNLIQPVFTVELARLLSETPEHGASMIQKNIEGHKANAIDKINKELESSPKIFEFEVRGENGVGMGSLPRFQVYEVDFGWGKPEGVRSGSNNRFDGMVCLYRGKSGGRSIDVEISLEAPTMEKLEQDKGFLVAEN